MSDAISVLSTGNDENLGKEIARLIGGSFVPVEVKVFSDGESKIRVPTPVTSRCVIVQSSDPPTDTKILRILMMAEKAVQDGCKAICAVIPYLAYARQDRPFLSGEIATIGLVSKLFKTAGIQHVVTVDIHSENAVSQFAVPLTNVSAIPQLAAFAKEMHLERPAVISPDAGGRARARLYAETLGTDLFALEKERNRETGEVSMRDSDLNVDGRDCIIVDDIISTGASIAKASNVLMKKGARSVLAFCTHALLTGDAADRIKAAGVREIVATNSISGPCSKVNLGPLLASAVRTYFGGLG